MAKEVPLGETFSRFFEAPIVFAKLIVSYLLLPRQRPENRSMRLDFEVETVISGHAEGVPSAVASGSSERKVNAISIRTNE